MGKLRSNRVKRTPQLGITSDRYQFLGLEQAEPNLGDPRVGPSSVGANPVKSGTPYQIISVSGHEGERYWTPAVGIGTTFGVISVYVNGALAGNDNRFSRIHGLDFVGTGVTIETPPVEFGDGVGIATVRFTVIDQKNVDTVGQVVYNSPTGLLAGADNLVYYNNNVGLGSTLPKTRLDVVGNGNFTGVVTASTFSGTATTSINVSGGIASVTSLRVTGVSTVTSLSGTNANFTGIVTAPTFSGSLQGNADTSTNVSGGTANVTALTVSGTSTVGFLTGTNAVFSGIVTANQFVTLGDTSLDKVTIGTLRVTGITTLGVTTATNLTAQTLNVSGVSTFNNNVEINGTIVGPSTITIDPAVVGNNTGKVVIKGDLEVQGTQTTINSTTLVVEDKNIELAVVTSPTDITADGGGVIVKGNTDHSILFDNANDAWKFTENLLPTSNLSNNLGSSSVKWNQLHVNEVNSTNSNLTNLNVTGISTVGFLTGTNAVYSGIITAGVVTATNFYGNFIGNINGNIDANAATATTATNVIGGIASVTSLRVSGVSTVGFLTGTNAFYSGVVTATTFSGNAATATTATNVVGGIGSINQLQVTGISTFTNGPVLIGSGTSTGTASQRLQVTGGAYVSGSVGFGTTNPIQPFQVGSGTTIVVIDTMGDLGIGTTNPTEKLHVVGNGLITGNLTVNGTISGTVNANAATATTATNVIGGIASVSSLNVTGISTLGRVNISSGIITAVSGVVTYYGDGSKLTGVGETSTSTQISAQNTSSSTPVYPTFATQTGVSTLTIATSGLVYIPSTGNLGIGTTNPGEKLQVDGNIRVGVSSTSNYITFLGTWNDGGYEVGFQAYTHTYIGERIYENSTQRSELLLFKGNDGLVSFGSTPVGPDRIRLASGELVFQTFPGVLPNSNEPASFEDIGISTAPTTRVVITRTGSVGIATTNPIQPFQINSGTNVVVIDNLGELGIGTTNPTQKLHVVGNGLVTGEMVAGQFTSSSDESLKEIIGKVSTPLDKVLQMSSVEFTWKTTGSKSIGVIAQEVEEIFPELVTTSDGFKSVNYNGIVAVLIEAIKEQQSQIDGLKAKLET